MYLFIGERLMSIQSTSDQRREILLCDDSLAERTALGRILRSSGYGVHEAGDGEAAIVLLKHNEIDLVLLDLNMPEVDGFEVLGYLQQHRKSLPVILLSGMSPDRIQPKIHSLPTQELPPLLMKPVDPDQLLDVMDMQLNGDLPGWDTQDASATP
jgi:CheY-like chemotaxis protein